MKKIYINDTEYAMVDDEDYRTLSKISWYKSSGGYAVHHNTTELIYMHRVVSKTPKGKVTDHINRNKLDNRKINLRVTVQAENMLNGKTRNDSVSGHRGVTMNLNS